MTTETLNLNELPLAHLNSVKGDLESQIKELKKDLANVGDELVRRYEERGNKLRELQGKEFGAVSMEEDGFKVTVDRPKKVKWDSSKLHELASKMEEAGDDPTQYLKITYGVDERKFKAWPKNIQKAFLDARTVTPGKLSVKLKEA